MEESPPNEFPTWFTETPQEEVVKIVIKLLLPQPEETAPGTTTTSTGSITVKVDLDICVKPGMYFF